VVEASSYIVLPLRTEIQPVIKAAGALFSEHHGRGPIQEWRKRLRRPTGTDPSQEIGKDDLPRYLATQEVHGAMVFPVSDGHVYESANC
jgi:hypothetical protein